MILFPSPSAAIAAPPSPATGEGELGRVMIDPGQYFDAVPVDASISI